MSEEIFDVVNERDKVIGQNPRSEVHARGLLHRAVHVLVFNSRGEIFLQKRSMKKDRQPGVWDSSCSGHVDSGENYDETAVRELREELGLKVQRRDRRKSFSKLTPARKRTRNLSGFIAAKATGRSNCIPTKLKRAAGSRRKKSQVGLRKGRRISRARLC